MFSETGITARISTAYVMVGTMVDLTLDDIGS